MAGYPDVERSLQIITTVAEQGVDIIEIGVPFSDPVADGVTIEAAGQLALANGFSLSQFLIRLGELKIPRPLVLMSYLNPLLAYGRDKLLDDARSAGIRGMIVPDLPPEEAGEWLTASKEKQIDMVFLVAPTSTDDRIREIATSTRGFLYAVSVAGTTGVRTELDPKLPTFLARLKRITDNPVAVGFGISRPEHIRALHGHADGAVVGSRIVQAIHDHEDLTELITTLKNATRV
jgi:tryptophan synthase alpha chain